MVYKYLKGFDEFPTAREELESQGVMVTSISTVDNVIQVNVESYINHPDFVVVE